MGVFDGLRKLKQKLDEFNPTPKGWAEGDKGLAKKAIGALTPKKEAVMPEDQAGKRFPVPPKPKKGEY